MDDDDDEDIIKNTIKWFLATFLNCCCGDPDSYALLSYSYHLSGDDRQLCKKFLHPKKAISETPCIRQSFMLGISSGVLIGLGYFLFTSKPRMAVKYACGSYATITIGTWFLCRVKRGFLLIQKEKLLKGMQQSILMEGTELADQQTKPDDISHDT